MVIGSLLIAMYARNHELPTITDFNKNMRCSCRLASGTKNMDVSARKFNLEATTKRIKINPPVSAARNKTGIKALFLNEPFFNKSYVPRNMLENKVRITHIISPK
jgi:hypothetical protein